MATFVDDGNCFVCGEKNPVGLKLRFRPGPEGGVLCSVRIAGHFQGWEGVVHGGLIATVLDETMIKAAAAAGRACVTGEITVKYLAPTPTGTALTARARVASDRGRILVTEAELADGAGKILAKASAKLLPAKAEVRT